MGSFLSLECVTCQSCTAFECPVSIRTCLAPGGAWHHSSQSSIVSLPQSYSSTIVEWTADLLGICWIKKYGWIGDGSHADVYPIMQSLDHLHDGYHSWIKQGYPVASGATAILNLLEVLIVFHSWIAEEVDETLEGAAIDGFHKHMSPLACLVV